MVKDEILMLSDTLKLSLISRLNRENLISLCSDFDQHGIYSDKDSIAEHGEIASVEQLRESLTRILIY